MLAQRVAAVLALTVFAVCLLSGAVGADNPFSTAVWRALVAMAGAFVIGLIVGLMLQKMLQENLKDEERRARNLTEPKPGDR